MFLLFWFFLNFQSNGFFFPADICCPHEHPVLSISRAQVILATSCRVLTSMFSSTEPMSGGKAGSQKVSPLILVIFQLHFLLESEDYKAKLH